MFYTNARRGVCVCIGELFYTRCGCLLFALVHTNAPSLVCNWDRNAEQTIKIPSSPYHKMFGIPVLSPRGRREGRRIAYAGMWTCTGLTPAQERHMCIAERKQCVVLNVYVHCSV